MSKRKRIFQSKQRSVLARACSIKDADEDEDDTPEKDRIVYEFHWVFAALLTNRVRRSKSEPSSPILVVLLDHSA